MTNFTNYLGRGSVDRPNDGDTWAWDEESGFSKPVAAAGGGGALVVSEAAPLSDAEIKDLITPVGLWTPSDSHHAIVPIGIFAVLDCSNGVYVDPDGAFTGVSIGMMPTPDSPAVSLWTRSELDIDAASWKPSPLGAGIYNGYAPPFPLNSNGSGVLLGDGDATTNLVSAVIGIQKSGVQNLTGGGSGNTLILTLAYYEVRVS